MNAIKEGIQLIYNKLKSNVQSKGLVAMESIGTNFDADTMEAITHIPATDESQKGKVIDEVAHEVRNPLTSIGGFARKLRSRMCQDDPNRNMRS